MLIYVTEKNGVFDPVVDISDRDGRMWIPHWPTKKIMEAQEEGEKHGYNMCARLAYVDYRTYVVLRNNLNKLCAEVENAKKEMMKIANRAGVPGAVRELSTAEFMMNNMAILAGAGDSYLIPDDEGELIKITLDEAKEIMASHEEEMTEDDLDDLWSEDEEWDDDEEDEDY